MPAQPISDVADPSPQLAWAGVRKLKLDNFRNYESLELTVDAAIIVLTGANGAGKTNLLEALSFLSPGRGLRNAHLGDVTYRGTDGLGDTDAGGDGWSVRVHLTAPDGLRSIATGLAPGNPSKRTILIDGQPAKSQNDLAADIGMVWMTPDMDRLFHDSAGQRRRFLDRLVYGFDPGHAARITAYTKTIRERARLLKGTRTGAAADGAWLSALEDRAAQQGIAVAAARRDIVARLNDALAQGEATDRNNEQIRPLPAVRVSLVGTVDDWLQAHPAAQAEDLFRAALGAERGVDTAAGRTGTGPHRSDLAAVHVGQNCPAARCSTGEQKAILLAMVLAYAEILARTLPSAPILLLDEIAAHLDSRRRQALFARLFAYPGQIWITGTDLAPFMPLSASVNTMSQDHCTADPVIYIEIDGGHISTISQDHAVVDHRAGLPRN